MILHLYLPKGDLNTYIAADWALDPLLRRPAMFPTDPAINPCLGPWRDPAPFAISGKPSSKGGKEAVKAKRVELPPAPSANASLPLWHALQQRVSGHGWNFSGGNRQVGGFPSPYAAGEAPFADAWEALHKAPDINSISSMYRHFQSTRKLFLSNVFIRHRLRVAWAWRVTPSPPWRTIMYGTTTCRLDLTACSWARMVSLASYLWLCGPFRNDYGWTPRLQRKR